MGYQNANAIYANWSHLGHAPFRLLVFMGLHSRDDGDPPVFFEGRDAAAVALGRMPPPPPDPWDESPAAEKVRQLRRTHYEAVKQNTQILVKAGAVTLVAPARPKVPATYAVHIKPPFVIT